MSSEAELEKLLIRISLYDLKRNTCGYRNSVSIADCEDWSKQQIRLATLSSCTAPSRCRISACSIAEREAVIYSIGWAIQASICCTAALTNSSSLFTIRPARSPTSVRAQPRLAVITGTPAANASFRTIPHDSERDGKRKQSMKSKNSSFCGPEIAPAWLIRPSNSWSALATSRSASLVPQGPAKRRYASIPWIRSAKSGDHQVQTLCQR